MSAKKTATNVDLILLDNIITLKSVYDKAGIKYFIPPCKDKYGQYPPCVKRVNSNGDMILSDKERDAMSEGTAVYIAEDQIFEVTDGKTYDLTNPHEAAEWEAIKNCPLIAKSRDERDAKGELVIDGARSTPAKPTRNGVAELYVYKPGVETQRRVSRKQLIHKAEAFIYNDTEQGQRNMARILGKNMANQVIADVIDFLLRIADKTPNKIIDLYTGDEVSLRLLFIEAKEKKVIYIKNKLYLYADNIVLGATDDAVIAWMKEPRNQKVLELIKKDTYPDYYAKND